MARPFACHAFTVFAYDSLILRQLMYNKTAKYTPSKELSKLLQLPCYVVVTLLIYSVLHVGVAYTVDRGHGFM